MKANDPFAAIIERCHVSSSQEERLRNCRFAGEEPEAGLEEKDTEESAEVYVESTGIMMMSPPDSSDYNDKNDDNTLNEKDIFQTPPEVSQISGSDDQRNDRTVVVDEEIAAGSTEGETAVDLGADTDLGFSQVELTQRFEMVGEEIHSKLKKVGVLKRESGIRECLSEIPFKRSKMSDKNPRSEFPNRSLREKLNSSKGSPYDCRYKSFQNNQNSEAIGENSAKRKLQFSTEVLELETEASHRGSGFTQGLQRNVRNSEGNRTVCNNDNGEGSSNSGRNSIEDIEKYGFIDRSAHNSSKIERRTQAIRALPVSICEPREKDARRELDSENHCGEITLLDVLRILARKCDYDQSLESRSILDVAKSRGMTFP